MNKVHYLFLNMCNLCRYAQFLLAQLHIISVLYICIYICIPVAIKLAQLLMLSTTTSIQG